MHVLLYFDFTFIYIIRVATIVINCHFKQFGSAEKATMSNAGLQHTLHKLR